MAEKGFGIMQFSKVGLILLLFFSPILIEAASDKTAIAERIAPIGKNHATEKIQPEQSAVTKPLTLKEQLAIGEKVYKRRCSFCHASGSAGAPRVSNKDEWQKRYESQNLDTLVEHVTKGYRMMPPKGTCMNCSPQDLQAAVAYILQLSGVKENR